jgi:glycosyltransferase involved in cell wall biosynthesis
VKNAAIPYGEVTVKRIALYIEKIAKRSGGAERLFIELANLLVARGYDVTCLHNEKRLGRPFYPLDHRVSLLNLYVRNSNRRIASIRSINVKIPKAPPGIKGRRTWYLDNWTTLQQLKDYFRYNSPELMVSFLPPANTTALVASIGSGTKVIPTNHNVPSEDYANPNRWSPNPYDRWLRLEALKHAAAIQVIFPEFARWLPQELRSRVVSIPNYVSKEFLEKKQPTARENIILAVGRIASVKNYSCLVEAWASICHSHRDWRLILYGEGPEHELIEARIRDFGVENSFILGGERSSLSEEYDRAAIFCHPALHEGFGLAPAEALASGLAVVAFSDCAGVNQFVVDRLNGLLVDRSDPQSLAGGLKLLMEDPELRVKLGSHGPTSVSRFNQEAFAESWIDLVEQVLGGGPVGPN